MDAITIVQRHILAKSFRQLAIHGGEAILKPCEILLEGVTVLDLGRTVWSLLMFYQ